VIFDSLTFEKLQRSFAALRMTGFEVGRRFSAARAVRDGQMPTNFLRLTIDH